MDRLEEIEAALAAWDDVGRGAIFKADADTYGRTPGAVLSDVRFLVRRVRYLELAREKWFEAWLEEHKLTCARLATNEREETQ